MILIKDWENRHSCSYGGQILSPKLWKCVVSFLLLTSTPLIKEECFPTWISWCRKEIFVTALSRIDRGSILFILNTKYNMTIHSTFPKSRTRSTICTSYTQFCPNFSKFSDLIQTLTWNQCPQLTWLAEWIIDDSCLVSYQYFKQNNMCYASHIFVSKFCYHGNYEIFYSRSNFTSVYK